MNIERLWRLKVIHHDGSPVLIEGTKEAMSAAYEALKEAMEAPDGTGPAVMEFKGVWSGEFSVPTPMKMLVRPSAVLAVYLNEF